MDPSSMLTLAWDVDDVLNDLTRNWFETKWLAENPGSLIRYEEITKNPPAQILGISLDEYLASLDEFRFSDAFSRMLPNEEVLKWFSDFGQLFRHVAVTAVPRKAAHLSAAWVIRHFGAWIRSFNFVPSFRVGEDLPIYDEDKGAFLHSFGRADLLIDDNLENIASANRSGIKTLVFPRPWNNAKMTVRQMVAAIAEKVKS